MILIVRLGILKSAHRQAIMLGEDGQVLVPARCADLADCFVNGSAIKEMQVLIASR